MRTYIDFDYALTENVLRSESKTPGRKNSSIDLGFTPVQTYLQVRRSSSVQRLPRSEAYKESASPDEILNAHRLKEVLRTKKVQEVYSEEGYEDSAYDHGDHERHAEHGEAFKKHKDGKYKVNDPVQHIYDVANAESAVVEKSNKPKRRNKPIIKGQRVEKTSMEVAYMRDKEPENLSLDKGVEQPNWPNSRKFKRAHKYSSQVKAPLGLKRDFVSQRDDFWKVPSHFEDLTRSNNWGINFGPSTVPPRFRAEDKLEKKSDAPPSLAFGYIHSLTDAHYSNKQPLTKHKPRPIPSRVINMTEAFRSKRKEGSAFEPKKQGRRIKRETREAETDQYEKELSKDLDEQEKNIIGNALGQFGGLKGFDAALNTPPKPLLNFKPSPQWEPPTFDTEKYPYFYSRHVDPYSPLRYASHPREFPRKSGRDMEFYEGRDRAVECEPIDVSLDNEPKENSTWHLEKQPGQEKRIVRLGDKIQCLKNKFFGEDPLDSPFFKEDEIIAAQTRKARADEELKYHSSYQYQPNKTLDVFVAEKPNDNKVESSEDRVRYQTIVDHSPVVNKTSPTNHQSWQQNTPQRVIPVSETFLPELTTVAPIMGMLPPPVRRIPFSLIRLPQRPKPQRLRRRVQYNYPCLQPITKMTITERADDNDIIYECSDVTVIKTIRDGNDHYQIIPKMRRTGLLSGLQDQTGTFRLGEVIESNNLRLHRRKRGAPPSTTPRRKSMLFPNKSLLDKIVKRPVGAYERQQNKTKNASAVDLGDRSPDELIAPVSLSRSTTTTTTTTIRPKESTTTTTSAPVVESIKLEPRPLSRLSGRDFLVRYHKSKGKASTKPSKAEFWKVVPTPPTHQKSKRDETAAQAKSDDPESTSVLLYIVDQVTGRGQWVTEEATDRPETTTEGTTKKYASVSERQLKKQNARKNFFTKKLKKDLS